MRSPTIRSAHLLLLVSALLAHTGGSLLQRYSPSWGLLATELLLILAPAVLLLYRQRLPASRVLALRWPGAWPMLLAALTGLGTFAVGSLLAAVGYKLLGYGPSSGLSSTGAASALVMLLATTIVAPLCEEAFFRGYLFSAYLRRGARFAIPVTAIFFALYHMRLAGLAGLVPAAFALSFVRWRSDSLLPGIVLHVVQNFIGTGLWQLGVVTGHSFTISVPALGVLALIGAVAMVLFALTVRRSPNIPDSDEPRFWPRAWPAVAFGVLYIALGTGEFLLNTDRLPVRSRPLQYSVPVTWTQPRRWRYEVRNAAERKIGELDCRLEPAPETVSLTCTGTDLATNASWRHSDLQLLTLSRETGGGKMTVEPDGDGLAMSFTAQGGEFGRLDLPPGTLVAGEWPWRLIAHPFTQLGPTAAKMASPAGVELVKLNVVTMSGRMRVLDREFSTTVVRVGDHEEASYATDGDHLLLRYSDGTVSYVIMTAE